MLTDIEFNLQDSCPIAKQQPVVIGVSGGPDSLCLAHILHKMGYYIVVAHFDHCLRKDSAQDAEFVEKFASGIEAPFIIGQEDVSGYAENNSLSIEEAARELRYRFLFNLAEERKAQAVIVAHNANDQVETVLMHMLRGAGLSGLKGMKTCSYLPQYNETIPLVRPLLNTWRKDIIEYCEENALQPIIDLSNQETIYFRNKLRHEFILLLETYNPNIQAAIWRMSKTLADDHEALEGLVQTAWKECVRQEGEGYLALSIQYFISQPMGIQRGLFRKAISMIRPGLRDIDFDVVERGIAVMIKPTASSRIDLTAGLCMLVESDVVWIAAWDVALPTSDWPQIAGEELELVIPGTVDLGNGWLVRVEHVEGTKLERSKAFSNDNPYRAWMDASNVGNPLCIRKRQSSDRFQPLGLDGHSQKLAHFYINLKIPRRARDAWPLICKDEIIHWIPGYRQSHQSGITDQSTKLLTLNMEKISG